MVRGLFELNQNFKRTEPRQSVLVDLEGLDCPTALAPSSVQAAVAVRAGTGWAGTGWAGPGRALVNPKPAVLLVLYIQLPHQPGFQGHKPQERCLA